MHVWVLPFFAVCSYALAECLFGGAGAKVEVSPAAFAALWGCVTSEAPEQFPEGTPDPREECAQDKKPWKLTDYPGKHLGDCRTLRIRCCWPVQAFRILWLLGYREPRGDLVVWILLCAFTWFSLHKLMTVLTVCKQICFSFDLPLLFLSCSSPFCKLAGGAMVFFMLTVQALPLNSPQIFVEGCFTLNHSSPSFSFYSLLHCSDSPSLSSNNISPKDQVEKQFTIYIECMYMYSTRMH